MTQRHPLLFPPQSTHHSTAMEKLAVELLTLIAFFACTDGGQTGCTLALVSKRIRAASRPARFYSVALFGSPQKIEQFLTCYEAERARRRKHSLASSAPPPSVSTQAVPGSLSAGQPMSRAEFFAAMQRRTQHWRSTQDNLDEHYNRVVPTLIRAVAADVQTLALVQAQWRCASVVRCSFPSLRELTVVGGDPTFLPFAFVPSGRPLYPALKRLHHILAFVQKDVDMLNWAKHAPNVTHLRVSRVDYHPRITVDSLNEVISETASEEYFPHLQQVMIQPHPAPPPVRASTTAHLAFRDFLVHLQRIRERAKVPVLVLPPLEIPKMVPGVDPHRMCILRVKAEWQERIEADGAGCWEERPHSHGMKSHAQPQSH
ncbi:hypothetical protein C8T65DRAFT_627432 [Cerioporus squamosus]|nr:hypothetical protein C8T65DRAFT_627432 [Cerioporus squamosus]